MAKYLHACSEIPPVILRNEWICLEMYRRAGGWGWGEISDAGGNLLAVLEHLGEIRVCGFDIPMRLEAKDVSQSEDADGRTLSFSVKSSVIPEKLAKSSFSNWMNYTIKEPLLEGKVSITLENERPLLRLRYALRSTADFTASYVRGPWLKVGEGSFGAEKDDAILPGVEWVCGREWSSGTDFFKDPWALRFAPHRNKISVPVMAVSHKGTAVSLSWQPDQAVTRWFNTREIYPQPVFATPNFIDRSDNSLLGLMLPDAVGEETENRMESSPGLVFHLGQELVMDAEIAVSRGNSLQAVVDWVGRHGLNEIGKADDFDRVMERIARAYDTNLWLDGRGFGCAQNPESFAPRVPDFLRRYTSEHEGEALAASLKKKIDFCDGVRGASAEEKTDAKSLLAMQRADGSFPFDPDGRHYTKDDFVVTRDYCEPMGLAGDTALDICLLPSITLLDEYEKTGEKCYLSAAVRALDYCIGMTRPEGGDYWETPLHSPNLFAAGHAAVANELGFRATGERKYRDKAVYWIRALLPFTHLWEPEAMRMLYDTKPCLCASDWYFANWVRDHVQWEVLRVFVLSAAHGIDWAKIDTEIDWHAFHRGVTAAASRWMLDHRDGKWRPHNMPWTLDMYREGKFDACFPDTHNSVTGNYAGMAIMPEPIADNIYALADEGALADDGAE